VRLEANRFQISDNRFLQKVETLIRFLSIQFDKISRLSNYALRKPVRGAILLEQTTTSTYNIHSIYRPPDTSMWRKLSWTISIGKQLPASMSLRVHTLLWNRVTVAICPFFITSRAMFRYPYTNVGPNGLLTEPCVWIAARPPSPSISCT